MWYKPTAKPTMNAAPATTARFFPLLSHVWLTFRSSDFPVWQPPWVFKQAEFTPNLLRWTRHTRDEVGSENLEFLNMRLQGQSVPGHNSELGKMKMRLKDVGVRLPALRWTCCRPWKRHLIPVHFNFLFIKQGQQRSKSPSSNPAAQGLETHWVSKPWHQLFALLGCARLKSFVFSTHLGAMMPRPCNIQGWESWKCKDQSLGERKWTQAQPMPLGFGWKRIKVGKWEKQIRQYPGTRTDREWMSETQLGEHRSCVSDRALVSGFLANWYIIFLKIYVISQNSPMLWRKQLQGFDQALPNPKKKVKPCLHYSWFSSNAHSRGECVNPKHVVLASHLPPQPELQLVGGRHQVERNAKNRP